MLVLKDVNKKYKSKFDDVQAVNGVNLTFDNQGMYFLVGKSGSGKTTLLNCLGLLDDFDSGSYLIDGINILDLSRKEMDSFRNEYIGFVFQEYNLLFNLTVYENICLAFELQGKKVDDEEIDRILTRVGMLKFKRRMINQLSGGQKQRVAIARSLVKNPKMILADEPSGALDSETSLEIFELLKEISKESLVIVVSHDLEYANQFGDEVITIVDGRIENNTPIIEDVASDTLEIKNLRQSFFSRFKLGLKFLRRNKKGFIFSTILSSLALLLFGITFVILTCNTSEALYDTLKKNNFNYCTFEVSEIEKDYSSASTGPNFPLKAVNNLHQFGVENPIYGFRNNYDIDYAQYFSKKDRGSYADRSVDYDEEIFSKSGIKKIAGKLPASENEVMISSYVGDLFKAKGFEGSTIKSYDDLIGKKLKDLTITGVVNVPYDKRALEYELADDKTAATLHKIYGKIYLSYRDYGLHYNLFFANDTHKVIADGDYTNVDQIYIFLTGKNNKTIKMLDSHTKEKTIDVGFERLIRLRLQGYVIKGFTKVDESLELMSLILPAVGVLLCIFTVLIMYHYTSHTIEQKKKEIGILKSLGSSNEGVFGIFYTASFLSSIFTFIISLIFMGVGIVIFNQVFTNIFKFKMVFLSFGFLPILVVLLLSIIVPLIGSFKPIYTISKKKPVEIIINK